MLVQRKRLLLLILISFIVSTLLFVQYNSINILKLNHTNNQGANPPPKIKEKKIEIQYPYFMDFTSLQLDDNHRLIDLTDFDYLINQLPCPTTTNILIMVHSAISNVRNRDIIRRTWGYKIPYSRVLFTLGATDDESKQHELELENQKTNDIIQGNFIDSYHNLTYKHIMILKWTVYNCPQIDYLIKVDDDIVFNTPAAYEFFHSIDKNYFDDKLYCIANSNQPIIREKNHKWYVSEDEMSGEFFPDYCSGYNIVYPIKTAFKMYRAAQTTPYFWIDDVHVTGTISKKANITITNFEVFDNIAIDNKKLVRFILSDSDEDFKRFIFADQAPSEALIFLTWYRICRAYDIPSITNETCIDFV